MDDALTRVRDSVGHPDDDGVIEDDEKVENAAGDLRALVAVVEAVQRVVDDAVTCPREGLHEVTGLRELRAALRAATTGSGEG